MIDGVFHGCLSYVHTRGQRERQFEFSNAILESKKHAGLLVRMNADGTPEINGTDTFEGRRVADVRGWAPSKDGLYFEQNTCNGGRFKGFEMVTPDEVGFEPALRMLRDGEVDAVWMMADHMETF